MPAADQVQQFQRVILVVLDGVGVGELPDADQYGDRGAATLQHVARHAGGLTVPTLESLGLGRIAEFEGVGVPPLVRGCWGKMAEASAGKDSVTGHWELAGLQLDQPFAVFPDGFPDEIIDAFSLLAGCRPLGNIRSSGTDILELLGEEHLRTGRPIVYTSIDSVFQIAAHEEILPPEQLYALCQATFDMLRPYNICRVIARPFLGDRPVNFYRTSRRHDYSQKPVRPTLLKLLCEQGITTCGIGKIHDLFAGEGLSVTVTTSGNADGMDKTLSAMRQYKSGLVMTNLVDFDMLYGHRLDNHGFARALEEFDAWLPQLQQGMADKDLLIISADHGCDPDVGGTDHTREYVPLLVYHHGLTEECCLGVRGSFADVAATVADIFGIFSDTGDSFLNLVK